MIKQKNILRIVKRMEIIMPFESHSAYFLKIGDKLYSVDDKLHRANGPAMERFNGCGNLYFTNGKRDFSDVF